MFVTFSTWAIPLTLICLRFSKSDCTEDISWTYYCRPTSTTHYSWLTAGHLPQGRACAVNGTVLYLQTQQMTHMYETFSSREIQNQTANGTLLKTSSVNLFKWFINALSVSHAEVTQSQFRNRLTLSYFKHTQGPFTHLVDTHNVTSCQQRWCGELQRSRRIISFTIHVTARCLSYRLRLSRQSFAYDAVHSGKWYQPF